MGWPTFLAWLVAASCALLALRRLRSLQLLRPPEPDTLLSELLAEAGAIHTASELVRRAAIADLNQRLSDVSFELELLPARITALTRICLASGTALALFGYIGAHSDTRSALERALALAVCVAAGLSGATCVQIVGRLAKQRVAAIRDDWDRSSREAGKALGTALEAPHPPARAGR